MQDSTGRSSSYQVVETGGHAPRPLARPKTRTVAVIGGKGGVGKTTIVANLAIALHARSRNVLVVDGDLGMANVDLQMGVVPRYTLHDVVVGDRTIDQALLDTPEGVRLLAGSSGVAEMADLDDVRCERLLRSLSLVEDGCDLILVDTAPGIHRAGLHLARAADDVIIVTTPEPTAITNAYACLRILIKTSRRSVPWILVNRARDRADARAAFQRLQETARSFLTCELRDLGFVLEDQAVGLAVRRQQPFMRLYPGSGAAGCMAEIAQRLVDEFEPEPIRLAPDVDGKKPRRGSRSRRNGENASGEGALRRPA